MCYLLQIVFLHGFCCLYINFEVEDMVRGGKCFRKEIHFNMKLQISNF